MNTATITACSLLDEQQQTRVGCMYPQPDPLSPSNWSGTPRSLALALSSLGNVVVPIGYAPAKPIRGAARLLSYSRGRGAIARGSELMAEIRTRYLVRAIQNAGPLDALVSLGTDLYHLPRVAPVGIPVATYDDATLAQMMRHADSDPRRNAYPEREVERWSERQAAASRFATACCVSTGFAAVSMTRDYGVPAGRVHVVGMGHRPRTAVVGCARNWRELRFLFVGADWGRKNGDIVVRAFARLRDRHPNAVLDLVGDHAPISEPGVVSHGFLPREDDDAQHRLDSLYTRATAFVLPSRFDPWGIAWLEAASAGLPVVASTEGGASDLLGEAALCVHPDDEDALLTAMQRLADPFEARRLGELARRRAAESTWTTVASRILRVLGVEASAVPCGQARTERGRGSHGTGFSLDAVSGGPFGFELDG